MAGLRLGNHFFDDVLELSLSNIADGKIFGIVDQISTASIEISSDSTDVTDKAGNVVYTRYNAKSGTVNMQNAFFHPVIANAQSGSPIRYASANAPIQMPKMVELAPAETYDVSDAIAGSIHVIGIYGNGANDVELTPVTSVEEGEGPTIHENYLLAGGKVTVPSNGSTEADKLAKYVLIYERDKEEGMALTNSANTKPEPIDVKMLVSYIDMCTKETKPAIVHFPSFTPDPNMTLNFDRENPQVDFNGTLQTNFCSADKELYTIYYPDEDVKIVTGYATA